MASLVDELLGVVPRLVERTRDQFDLASRVVLRLPCVARVLGGASSDDARTTEDTAEPAAVVVPLRPLPSPATSMVVGDLAIPGYDELAASQVIPRLDGLEPNELDAVRSYESSHRGRRTILARIDQLQTG